MIERKCKCGAVVLFDDDFPPQFLDRPPNCAGGRVFYKGVVDLKYEVLPRKVGFIVDHEDRNIHNLQRNNLRYATTQQNLFNRKMQRRASSGYIGVYATGPNFKKPWQASIRKDNKVYSLGCFHNAENAARARDKKAIELFGEFAVLNFPNK